jgi:hypothetical protein
MNLDIDSLIRAAMRRIMKSLDRRIAIAHGKPPSTAARSAGQLWGKRWIHKRENEK